MRIWLRRLGLFNKGHECFGRYYAGVLGSGTGYPTADEARRDLRASMLRWDYPRLMQ
jgi:hypothetical protein